MQFKDYLSVVALIISLCSFWLAFGNFRLGRRVKLSELRFAVLAKGTELGIRLNRAETSRLDLIQTAHLNADHKTVERLSALSMAPDIAQCEDMYASLASLPQETVLSVYEKMFHRLHDVSEQIDFVEEQMRLAREMYPAVK